MQSALKTPGCEIEFKFYLNDDDPRLNDYKNFLREDQYIIGPDQSTSYSWNLLSQKANFELLFVVGDDAQFIGENWGVKVLGAFDTVTDKIICAYPKVPTLGKNKNPHFCLHKNWISALGYFVPPIFHHWYIDTWVREVSQGIGRFYLLDDFQMSVETVKDYVSKRYHNSWLRQKDDYLWSISRRYREKDIETLLNYINNIE